MILILDFIIVHYPSFIILIVLYSHRTPFLYVLRARSDQLLRFGVATDGTVLSRRSHGFGLYTFKTEPRLGPVSVAWGYPRRGNYPYLGCCASVPSGPRYTTATANPQPSGTACTGPRGYHARLKTQKDNHNNKNETIVSLRTPIKRSVRRDFDGLRVVSK